jgi:hypothetical protein
MKLERDHLALALRHIELAERRIFDQRTLIEHMAKRGLDTKMAETLLETMLNTLERMHDHRQLIEAAIAEGRE